MESGGFVELRSVRGLWKPDEALCRRFYRVVEALRRCAGGNLVESTLDHHQRNLEARGCLLTRSVVASSGSNAARETRTPRTVRMRSAIE